MARPATQPDTEPLDVGEVVYDDLVSVEEYLRIEEASEERHEYVSGVLFGMVGATRSHHRLVRRVTRLLEDGAGDGPCEIASEAVKVRAQEDQIYYPDVVVTCDPADDDELMIVRPCLIAEVLSPSTAAIDRREKGAAYRRIPSLKSYLVISNEERRIQHFWRDDDARWHVEFLIEGEIKLRNYLRTA
jgi:Uma2 family endonuclease